VLVKGTPIHVGASLFLSSVAFFKFFRIPKGEEDDRAQTATSPDEAEQQLFTAPV